MSKNAIDVPVKINADIIRNMSIENLAKFMLGYDGAPCPPISRDHCEDMCCARCWLKWLSLPVVNGEFNDNIYWQSPEEERQQNAEDSEKLARQLALREEFEEDPDFNEDEHIRWVEDYDETCLVEASNEPD